MAEFDYYTSVIENGVIVRQWDDPSRTFTARDSLTGAVTTPARAYTAAENTAADKRATAQTSATNVATIRQRASNSLANNATFLAIAAPTLADITVQVQSLTRECNQVIRLALGQLDTTTGT